MIYKIPQRKLKIEHHEPQKIWSPGRVGNSCSASGTRCVIVVRYTVINHQWGKDGIAITMTNGTYLLWYSVMVNQVKTILRKLKTRYLRHTLAMLLGVNENII